MNRELIGVILIVSPFLAAMVITYICGWFKAIDDYRFNNDEGGLIAMSLFSIVSLIMMFGIHLLLSK
jgi:uncharacterized membrane protein HdeD (DUF308 family)